MEEYQGIDWDTLWKSGGQLVDKPIRLKCYWHSNDQGFASGFGKSAVPFLAGADPAKYKLLRLREVPEMAAEESLKGYVRLGTAAADYVEKEASTAGGDNECESFFFVYAVVRPPAAKLMGKGPQIVLEIQAIRAD